MTTNTSRPGLGLVSVIALLLSAAACGVSQGPGSGPAGAKGDQNDQSDFAFETLVTAAHDGQTVEIGVGDPLRVELVGPAPGAEGAGWICLSCSDTLPPSETGFTPNADGQGGLYHFVMTPTAEQSGHDFQLDFAYVSAPLADGSQIYSQYFSVTIAVQISAQEAQARDDAFLQESCKLLEAEPAFLNEMIPEPDLRARLQADCAALAASGRTPPPGCSGVTPPDRAPFGKRIALTFDDGPNTSSTPLVLDVLAAHPDVKATFFVNGKNAHSAAARQLLARILQEGHLIANHTEAHVDSSKQSAAQFGYTQVAPTDQIIAQAFADAGIALPEIKFFRFPFGATNCGINNVVQTAGYQIVGWHIDTADWCFNSAKGGYGYCDPSTFKWVPDSFRNDYVGYTVSQAKKNGGGILLMHDVHRFTREALDNLIATLEGEDFTFVRLDDAGAFPKLNDGIGVGNGSVTPPPAVQTSPFGAACLDKSGKAGTDPQGLPWQDYSGYKCVDIYHPDYEQTGCRNMTKSRYCDGAANILCCVK